MAQVERITESHQIKQDIPGGIHVSHRSKEEIESLARFAVDEHNKKAKAHLVFEKVVVAMDQVVAGIMCYITLVAADGHKKNVYEAKVWEKPWEKFKELVEFKLIVGT